ncbi:MAG: hypothetical protein CMI54_00440 [Parcubacteria group bacterium]|nr:hypothetical protein [Parcubacteria group bacterium]|tara:strand:- start:27 stop:395 length:369 start_codon:yes stop_codon:yes gene_type:complete
MKDLKTITLDGVDYVRADSMQELAPEVDGLKYCIVRTYSAGVFAGYIKDRNGKEGTVLNARRLWRWNGAASLSQLAVDGTNDPENCKFPCEVPSIDLMEIIEVIPCSEKAKKSINAVTIWEA